MIKRIYKFMICLACIVFFTASANAQTNNSTVNVGQTNTSSGNINNQTVKSILVEMDKRMNKNSLLNVGMQVWENNEMSEYYYTMKAKDNFQYLLLRYYDPERWKNTSILMVKEDIWIYDHSSDRFIEVPRNMAFGGTDIAHGDVLRLNISNNYDGKIIKEDNDTWTLELTTTNRKMPYNSMEIIINKKGYYPVTAKCFAKSKKLIKTIEYSEVKEVNGTIKPTKYTFLSPYEPDKYTIVKMIDEKLMEYPDYIFDKWTLRSRIDE